MPTGAALECDTCKCPRIAQVGVTHEELRESLRKVGWLCRDETDVCPTCRAKMRKGAP